MSKMSLNHEGLVLLGHESQREPSSNHSTIIGSLPISKNLTQDQIPIIETISHPLAQLFRDDDGYGRACPACVSGECNTNVKVSGLPIIQIIGAITVGFIWAGIFIWLYANFFEKKNVPKTKWVKSPIKGYGGGSPDYGYGETSYEPPRIPVTDYGAPPPPSMTYGVPYSAPLMTYGVPGADPNQAQGQPSNGPPDPNSSTSSPSSSSSDNTNNNNNIQSYSYSDLIPPGLDPAPPFNNPSTKRTSSSKRKSSSGKENNGNPNYTYYTSPQLIRS